jgi:hypothetical protein
MPKPVFNQKANDLYMLSNGGDCFQIAFLASPGSGFGKDLEVDTAWNDESGIYIFLPGIPPDADSFINNIRSLVSEPAFLNTKFLWVLDPSFSSSPWVVNKLLAAKDSDDADTCSILQTEAFAFADYSLSIGRNCKISGPTPDNGYGFTITPSADFTNIIFYSPLAAFPISSPNLNIRFDNQTEGCFSCNFKLSKSESDGDQSSFDLLQVLCAYFMADPEDTTGNSVKTLRFPVLCQPDTDLNLYGIFDPLNPLKGNRTSLSLINPTGQISPPQMESYYITAAGHTLSLTPLQGSSGEPDARFVFSVCPLWVDPLAAPSYYLTLEGAYSISIDTDSSENTNSALVPSDRLVCGISGTEYMGFMADSGNILHFTPGGNAYMPQVSEDSVSNDAPPSLTDHGTTAWVYVTPPTLQDRIYYYSQPEQSLMYNTASTTGHLDFLEVPAAVLPAVFSPATSPAVSSDTSFPMVPFRGISQADMEYCRQIEYKAIIPTRRTAIENISAALYKNDPVRGAAGDGNATGVTPQGLIIEMDDNLIDWKCLVLGNTNLSSSQLTVNNNWLQLTDIGDSFRAVLQSNQLFLVAANPTVFRNGCSVRYQLTEHSFIELANLPQEQRGSDDILNTVKQKTIEAQYPIYDDLTAYRAQLSAWAPGITGYYNAWETEGAYFELVISGWKFILSPYQWYAANRATHQNTIMIMKFNSRPLDNLIEDISAWPWPEVAKLNDSLSNTRDELRSIFSAAKLSVAKAKENGTISPYENFVKNVITNPNWNGILFLNCEVPLDQLPSQLQGIAAGIDYSRFYAHHVGLNITPLSVENQSVQLGSTSMFGLIDYQDTNDLVFSENTEFDFKVLTLTILFENSCIKSYSSTIELLICELFGDLVLLDNSEHGNNLILEGTCQTDNGKDFYSFKQTGVNCYKTNNSLLETIEIDSSNYITLKAENQQSQQSSIVTSRFSLGGIFSFSELEGFDLFSFGKAKENGKTESADGYLRFSDFTIDMSFNSQDPENTKSFLPKASGIAFEMSQSRSRYNGLYNKFPLTLTGIIESPVTSTEGDEPNGVSPKEMGYSSISVPIDQGSLTYPWYGLAMDLDLGTLGSLAGNLGLKISLLAAWCKTETDETKIVFAGMKFLGLNDLKIKLPIEGILSLGFRNIQFLSSETEKGRLYMLRLRQFGIRLLGLSFPPGNNDIYLFGNPDNTSNTKLGWYAAYSDGKDDKKSSTNTNRMLSGRRNRRGGES